MKVPVIFFAGVLVSFFCNGQTPKHAPAAAGRVKKSMAGGYKLVWQDEFNKEGAPDTAYWRFEKGFVRNQELQWYQADNAYCKNGYLIIEGRREARPSPVYVSGSKDWKKKRDSIQYTSSSINTAGKLAWKYGRFIMRGRIDISPGMWPAWWTLGIEGNWPANGEIDMMEFYRSTALYNIMDSGQHWFSYTEGFTDSTNYHTWVMEWNSASSIKLYRDGVLKITYTGGNSAFSKPFYMLANLAIGGNSGGDPSGTAFPQYYYIDYIRVSQWW